MMTVKSHAELVAGQESVDLVTTVYRVRQQFPKDEICGLPSQIRMAASIPGNIAQGRDRL
jgi:four helix bundle protein